jgi:hypothetical protein
MKKPWIESLFHPWVAALVLSRLWTVVQVKAWRSFRALAMDQEWVLAQALGLSLVLVLGRAKALVQAQAQELE